MRGHLCVHMHARTHAHVHAHVRMQMRAHADACRHAGVVAGTQRDAARAPCPVDRSTFTTLRRKRAHGSIRWTSTTASSSCIGATRTPGLRSPACAAPCVPASRLACTPVRPFSSQHGACCVRGTQGREAARVEEECAQPLRGQRGAHGASGRRPHEPDYQDGPALRPLSPLTRNALCWPYWSRRVQPEQQGGLGASARAPVSWKMTHVNH